MHAPIRPYAALPPPPLQNWNRQVDLDLYVYTLKDCNVWRGDPVPQCLDAELATQCSSDFCMAHQEYTYFKTPPPGARAARGAGARTGG